jgi:hypothetical protein
MSNGIFQKSDNKMSLDAVSQEAGFQVPVENVTLPSKGLVYPVGHPLSNEESLEIKCLTAKEEDILTSRALIKNGTVISQLLRSCILNKSVDPDDMLVGDRNAILVAIRITGYGSDYKVKIQCPACSEDYENEFSLAQLKVKTLSAAPLRQNENLFEYTLPGSGQVVQLKLLTGRDELEISKIAEKKKKLQTQVDNSVTSRLFYSVIAINGETDRQKLSYIINNMRAGDSRALRRYIDKVEPGVEMKQEVSCPHCSDQSEVNIPLGISFFWPDLGN